MSVDLLSNMLSAIKNASLAGKPYLEFPHSKECEAVSKTLEKTGFLQNVKTFKEKESSHKRLHLDIVYSDGTPVITDVKRVSKPGRRIYKKAESLHQIAGGAGVLVVSTSRGVMSGKEARHKKLGGEVLCKAW